MRGEQTQKGIPGHGYVAKGRPYPYAVLRARVLAAQRPQPRSSATVSLKVLAPPQEPDRGTGGDVGDDGEGDEQRFGQVGLVDLARHKQEGLGVRDGLVNEREDGRVGEVDAGEEGKGVGRVTLDPGYWRCWLVKAAMLLVGTREGKEMNAQ